MNTVANKDAVEFMKDLTGRPKLILTDPPYGMNYRTNIPGDKRWNKSGETVKFDVLKNDKDLDSIDFEAFFKLCYANSADDSYLFCFCNDTALVEWVPLIKHVGYEWKDTIIWNKKCANGGDIKWPFINIVEFLLAFTKGKPEAYPLYNEDGELKKRRINIFHEGRVRKAEQCGHPTQKPLAICEQIIRTTTLVGEYVIDPFCGSGSTLVAAKKLGRTFDGSDLDPKYYQLAMDRLNGKTIALDKTQQTEDLATDEGMFPE